MVEPSNVVVTAFKPSEGGNGMVVRCCEIAGRETTARLWIAGEVEAIWRCDMLEEEQVLLGEPAEGGGAWAVPMEGFAITTLKVKMHR